MGAHQATIRTIQTAPVSLNARPEITVKGSRGVHVHSDFLLVRIEAETASGKVIEGFGEVSATPIWSGEDAGSAEHFIRSILAPALVGAPLAPVGALESVMDTSLAGNIFTKSGISIALWDCWARLLDIPLAVALGGPLRTEIPIKMSLSGDGQAMRQCFDAVTSLGIGSYKVKVGVGGLDADIARVALVRELAGTDAFIGVDVNGGWSRGDAARAVQDLHEYDVAFLEQPLAPSDLPGMRELRALGTPVVADESVFTSPDLVRVIQESAADVVSVYIGKAGGPGRALDQGRLAHAFGLGTVIGSNGEFGIGAAAQLHVACAMPSLSFLPNDIIGGLYYGEDVLDKPLDSDGRTVRLTDGPGLGVRPRPDLMQRFQ